MALRHPHHVFLIIPFDWSVGMAVDVIMIMIMCVRALYIILQMVGIGDICI